MDGDFDWFTDLGYMDSTPPPGDRLHDTKNFTLLTGRTPLTEAIAARAAHLGLRLC